jgi:Dolichyl-phosphate-mannose-protein mannosyltransferase
VSSTSGSSGSGRVPALVLILALAAGLRLIYLTRPFLDAHGFRQIDTAAMARNFAEGSFIPFDPQVDWGGAAGYLEAECPIVPALAAGLYRVFGVHETLARLIIIPFSVGLVWCVYRLTLALGGRLSSAYAAAFLMAISPAAVFFGRIFIPDTPMLFFTTLALLGFVEFARANSTRWLVIGSASLALGALIKLPAIVVAPAIAATLLQARGWPVLRDLRVWAAALAPLLVTAGWYWHAHQVFERTGLTFGIFGVQAKMYPAHISPGPWPSVYSKWSTSRLLTDVEFYRMMFHRTYYFLLMPMGFIGAAVGAVFLRKTALVVLGTWLASMILFVFVAGEVHRVHEYYQLPLVVIGAVAWPLFDAEWLARTLAPGPRTAAAGALVTVLGLFSFYYSGVLETHFRSRDLAVRASHAGGAIDAKTDDNTLVVMVDDYGIMSPMVLYFAHLKGWSFEPTDLSPRLIDHLKTLGADYFATTRWNEITRVRPDVAEHLSRHETVSLDGAPHDTRLINLRRLR